MSAFEMTGFIACIVGIAGLLYLFMWLSHRVDALEKAAKARKTRENALSDPVIERLKGIGWRFDDAFKRIVAIEARLYTLEESKNPTEAQETRENADNDMLFARIKRFERICMDHGERISRCQHDIDALEAPKNPSEAVVERAVEDVLAQEAQEATE